MDAEDASHEVATLLHLLKHYDRARTVFARYSARRKGDREVLNVKLQPRGVVTADLVSALVRSFPFRVRGPFLVDGSLELEILDAPVPGDAAHVFAPPQRKRKAASCIDAARDAVLKLIGQYHEDDRVAASNLVTATRDGTDTHGAWLEFDLAPAARIDLGFILACLVDTDTETVKSIALEARTPPVLLVRLYRTDEHRIISSWDVVPLRTPRAGTLFGVRHRVSFADNPGV